MKPHEIKSFCRKILHTSDVPIKIPGGGNMFAVVIEINAKMANDWLSKTNVHNRNCRQSRVRRLAADMKSDLWGLTHQAIAFDVNGDIVSGQHRLEAVVLSGVTIQQLVILNCSLEERAMIDQTLTRNVRDVASLAYGDELGGRLVAIARSMACGMSLRKPVPISPQEVYRFISEHRNALDYVVSAIKRPVKGVTTATVIGPICRAFYNMKRKDISRFISVLCEGFSLDDRDKPIILLRNWLLENRDGLKGSKGRQRAYARTCAALEAFKNSEQPIKLYEPKEEIFTLPESA